jgi:hypothetical protein
VAQEPVDGDLVALDDVGDAVGEAGLTQQIGEEQRRRRVLLARLQDHGVAARQRVGQHPERDHGREVERRDGGHDADGLADRVHIHAAGGLLAVAALEQVGDAAGELDVLEATGHLAEGVGLHLAVLGGQEGGDLLAIALHELAQVEHHLGAAGEGGGTPPRLGGAGGGDGPVDLLNRGEVDGRLLLAGRRVEHRPGPPRGALDDGPVDPVRDAPHER